MFIYAIVVNCNIDRIAFDILININTTFKYVKKHEG